MNEIWNRLATFLKQNGISVTKDFIRDLNSIVRHNSSEFFDQFSKEAVWFATEKYKNYNRYELLKTSRYTTRQKTKLRGIKLWRYEYRNSGYNLKCICCKIQQISLFVCAFEEDNSKQSGMNSYRFNIDRVISILGL